jgi:hypothetical protein
VGVRGRERVKVKEIVGVCFFFDLRRAYVCPDALVSHESKSMSISTHSFRSGNNAFMDAPWGRTRPAAAPATGTWPSGAPPVVVVIMNHRGATGGMIEEDGR